LNEQDLSEFEDPSGADEWQAQLLIAAEALRSLAHERRATWSAEPLDSAVAARARQRVEIAAPAPMPAAQAPVVAPTPRPATPVPIVAPTPRPATPAPMVAPTPRPAVQRPVVQAMAPERAATVRVATRPPLMRTIASRVSALFEPLGPWLRRLAVVGAFLALLVGVGWTARTYLPAFSAMWSKLPKLPVTPTTGMAVIESVPTGSQVLVDGKMVGTTPLTTELTAGPHVIEFRRLKATRKLKIDVVAGSSTVGRLDWTSKRTGSLQVTSVPPGARVIVDRRARGVTPLTVDGLSPGSHEVVLESADGSVRQAVDITADDTAEISQAIYAGWVHVSSAIEIAITEGTRGIHLDERNQVLLPPGMHELRFESRALGYRDTRRIEVKPGEITAVSIVPSMSALTVTATQPAEVFVDGERVGETPLTSRPLNVGTRDVVVKSASGGERRFTITVTVDPVRIDVDFSTP
jgi:hypothetical protein